MIHKQQINMNQSIHVCSVQLKAAYKLINSVCSINCFNSKALGSWQRINDHVQGRQGRSTPYIGDGLLLG